MDNERRTRNLYLPASANGRRLKPEAGDDLRVAELIAAFWEHARDYYYRPGGHEGELAAFKLALTHLKRLHGHTPAAEFGPLCWAPGCTRPTSVHPPALPPADHDQVVDGFRLRRPPVGRAAWAIVFRLPRRRADR